MDAQMDTQVESRVEVAAMDDEYSTKDKSSWQPKPKHKKRRKSADKRRKKKRKEKKGEPDEMEVSPEVQAHAYTKTAKMPVAKAVEVNVKQEEPQYTDIEDFYQVIDDELTTLRNAIVEHQTQMVDDASPLIWMVPHPPRSYITRLCCCTKCCGRCCDIYGHQKPVFHSRPKTAEVGTDSKEDDVRASTHFKDAKRKSSVKKEVVLDIKQDSIDASGCDSDVASGFRRPSKTSSWRSDDLEETELTLSGTSRSDEFTPKGGKKKALEVVQEAKRVLMDLKLLREKYEELKRARCDTPEDARKRDLEIGELVRDLNLHLLATVSVDVHPEKRTRYMVGVDEPDLLYRRKFQEGRLADLVAASIQESLSLMKKNVDFDEIANTIKAVMVFLSKLVADPAVRYLGSENYRVLPLHQLDEGVTTLVQTVFADSAGINVNTEVLVKSPPYFKDLATLGSLEPRSVLNYLGFRILVHFGTFMSSSSLQQMRSVILGYSIDPYRPGIKEVCSREVEHVLPPMYFRAFALRQQRTGFHTMAQMWATQVEDSFRHGLSRLSWIPGDRSNPRDSTDMHLAHFKLSLSTLYHFYPPWIVDNKTYQAYVDDLRRELASVDQNRIVQLWRALLRVQQQQKTQQLVTGLVGRSITGSLFDTLPSYNTQKNSVFIPVAVMNHSIPARGSLFAFHIARFGVRIFRGLLPVIYNDFVFSEQKQEDVPMLFSDAYQKRLQETVQCLLDAFQNTPQFLKSNFLKNLADVTAAGFSFLEQTVALVQAFSAFQERLNIKRIWKSDFRLSGLPKLSAEQLFFVYYALDNCEASDDDYRSRAFETRFALPPEDRVNFPLIHFEEFKKAFSCPAGSPMAQPDRCVVVT
ncbi:hypothetical protein HPB47_023418 [Ixodes persulcatus]|uniref:Uncharacterized protein n=1 Tax=Ixodes persulcatus TaxID=34615 RepID=A0AC60Q9C0_IXOPE|nr:hypothetical protein HPB47_023418 [Ixodes persulcatus]